MGYQWQPYFLLMAVLVVDTGKNFLRVRYLDINFLGGLLHFVKSGVGGTKYQEGSHTRTTSRVEGHCLC